MLAGPAQGGRCLGCPSPCAVHTRHLISLCEGVQDRAEDCRVHHCRCVETQPGEVHGNLHAKVVADLICQGQGVPSQP